MAQSSASPSFLAGNRARKSALPKTCASCALSLLLAFALALSLTPLSKRAYAEEQEEQPENFVDGPTLFNDKDGSRGAFCEIFAVEYASDGSEWIHRAVNRSADDWKRGTRMNLFELGTSSKWLLTWNDEQQGFHITAVCDQGNPGNSGNTQAESIERDDGYGLYRWCLDADEKGSRKGDGQHVSLFSPRDDGSTSKDEPYLCWQLSQNPDGTYKIRNVGTQKYVGVQHEDHGDFLIQVSEATEAMNFEIDLLSQKSKNTAGYFGYAEQWMDNLPAATLLSSINMPGTHDTGSAHVHHNVEVFWAHDQKNYFEEQLNLGCRYFDIRCHGSKDGDSASDVKITHTIECQNRSGNQLYLEEIWNQALNFLETNSSETVIMEFSASGHEDNVAHAMAELIAAEIAKENDGDDSTVCRVWHSQDVPTLGQARGKIVLWRAYSVASVDMEAMGLTEDDFGQDHTNGEASGAGYYFAKPYYKAYEDYGDIIYTDGSGKNHPVAGYMQHQYQVSTSERLKYIKGTLAQTGRLTPPALADDDKGQNPLGSDYNIGGGMYYVLNGTNCTGSSNNACPLETARDIHSELYANAKTFPRDGTVGGLQDLTYRMFDNRYTGIIQYNFIDKPLARMVYETNYAPGATFHVYDLSEAKIECSDVDWDGTWNYVTPELTVTIEVLDPDSGKKVEKVLQEYIDYNVVYENNCGPGIATYKVTGTHSSGDSNENEGGPYYSGLKKGVFQIKKPEQNAYFTENPSKVYDYAGVSNPEIAPSDHGHATYQYYDKDMNPLEHAPTNVGTYYVGAALAETDYYNWCNIDPEEFTIDQRPVALALNAQQNGGNVKLTCTAVNFMKSDAKDGKFPGQISFTINDGEPILMDINENGVAVLSASEIPEGNYTVKVAYVPDEYANYKADPITETFDKSKDTRSIKDSDSHEVNYNTEREISATVTTR